MNVASVTIDGPHGQIAARVYAAAEPVDVGLLWLHGGGWIAGDLDMVEADHVARVLAEVGIPVVSADYAKAVDGVHFPVPSDEAVAAFEWTARHLGAARVCIGGASAGANLVAGAAKRLRDGTGTSPAGLLLVYPLVHDALPPFSAELQATVDAWDGRAFFFTDDIVESLTANFLGPTPRDDPYAFAANGPLAGMPPTYIVNAEIDTLRASGEAFAEQLRVAGVEVVLETEPGVMHGYLNEASLDATAATLKRIGEWLLAR